MRTKVIKKTYTFKYIDGWFESFQDYLRIILCADLVRDAFDLGRVRTVDFVVTNSRPKSLTNVHVMRKNGTIWTITTGPKRSWEYGLMGQARERLNRDFPKNATLYVSAYA